MPVSRCNSAGFQLLFGLALIGSTLALLSPGSDTPLPFPYADKLWHASGFFLLALLVDLGWSEHEFNWHKWLPLFLYGGLMELAQTQVPLRSAEWADWLADGAGLLLYGSLIAPALRQWQKHRT